MHTVCTDTSVHTISQCLSHFSTVYVIPLLALFQHIKLLQDKPVKMTTQLYFTE